MVARPLSNVAALRGPGAAGPGHNASEHLTRQVRESPVRASPVREPSASAYINFA
jgi:hypothetical protein